MKNIIVELHVLKDKEIVQKRDFLLTLIINMMDNMFERCNFIENLSTPMKVSEPDEKMNQLIDSIFGYYIYLYNNEPNSKAFINAALHDLKGYLKGETDGFSPRTKSYICYLKE